MSSSSVIADSDPASHSALPSASHSSDQSIVAPTAIHRVKAATKTYGKRNVEPVDHYREPTEASLHAPQLPGNDNDEDASDFYNDERVGKDVTNHLKLRAKTSLIVPESEQETSHNENRKRTSTTFSSSPIDRHGSGAPTIISPASSPTGRMIHHHSTDPTSEEEDAAQPNKSVHAVNKITAGSSLDKSLSSSPSKGPASGSDDASDNEDTGALAFLKSGNKWKEQLAALDDDDYDFDAAPKVDVAKALTAFPLNATSQSTLTSLATSESEVMGHNLNIRPPSGSDDDEEMVNARPSIKAQRRVILSEDEDEDDDDDDEANVHKAATKIARAMLTATSSTEDIEDEEIEEPSRRKRTKGALSKKEEDLMHRETAAIERTQEYRLLPRVKAAMKITEILSKSQRHQPLIAPIRKQTQFSRVELPSVSDEIEPATDSSQRQSSPMSSRAKGKQREMSPVAVASTLGNRRQIVIKRNVGAQSASALNKAMLSDDEDDELESPAELLAKAEKAALHKQYLERKIAAAKRAEEAQQKKKLNENHASDDSDIEIEIPAPAPTHTRRDRHSTPAADAQRPHQPASASKSARKIQSLDVKIPAQLNHDVDDETEAQIAFLMKGRGKKPKGWVPKVKPVVKKKDEVESLEALNASLFSRMAETNINERARKQAEARRKKGSEPGLAPAEGVAKVDIHSLLKNKNERLKAAEQEEQEEEDAADSDWVDEQEEEDEAGSDEEEAGEDDEALASGADTEADADSDMADEAIMAAPKTKRRVRVQVASDEEDDIPAKDMAGLEAVSEEAEPQRVQLPSFLDSQPDRGFSQFFDDDVSQAFGGGNDEGEGFQRRATQRFAAEETATQEVARDHALYLSKTQQMADNKALEERAAFDDQEPPETPRPGYDPPPRVYINKQGLMTQTRPMNLFGAPSLESPAGSEYSAPGSTSHIRTGLDSSSQRPSGISGFTQTQIAATQTPTQSSKDPNRLRRANASIGSHSYGELPATEVELASTVVDGSRSTAAATEVETQGTEGQELFPTAAQQPTARNAFDLMRSAAVTQSNLPGLAAEMERATKKKSYSAFIEQEADLSEEEDGALGRLSGDEDETNLDDELESLVDNEEVDRDIADEQDAMVDELYADDMAKKDAQELAAVQRIADGKERMRRKGLDIDDDDFDDDTYGISSKRAVKRQRVENLTTAQLQANEQTRKFALHITEGLVTAVRDDEVNYLQMPEEAMSDDEERDPEDEYEQDDQDMGGADLDMRKRNDGRRIQDEDDEDDELEPLPFVSGKGSRREAERFLADEEDRRTISLGRKSAKSTNRDDRLPSLEPRIHIGNSSSPAPMIKLKDRARITPDTLSTRARAIDDFGDLDSQYKTFSRSAFSRVQYKASTDSREESQAGGNGGNGSNGTTAGKNSSVTSFKKNTGSKASSADLKKTTSSSGNGSKKGQPLSKVMSFRRENWGP